MTENELEKEVVAICKRPRKEIGAFRQMKRKFSGLNRKDFHELWLKLIYRGSLEVTLDWKVQAPGTLNDLYVK
ncbi:MAG: hypothetical protein M1155_02635 [Patescibacteria group bacterium]|nr:hypothetical protein [Patescibacteria group bacterium]